jgi:hypothetical protein
MKLSLHITKNYNVKDYTKPGYIRIAVIDKDISKQYPSNYVCILPRTINPNARIPNKFQKKYGDKSPELMKKLIKQALDIVEDQDIKKELLARLKILNPKPKNLAKCNICGKEFKPRRYDYRLRKTCYSCLNKSRSSKK